MKIASWNVNSVRARLDGLDAWLKAAKPDVVCLQETKTVNETFPHEFFSDKGYNIALLGQKSYNGVAILSRSPLQAVSYGLPGNTQDTQARFIEADITLPHGAVRIACLYAPNGNPAPGEKYDYKMEWMARLHSHTQNLLRQEKAFILIGDFNVIPQPLDAANPQNWKKDAVFLPETRASYHRLLNLGLRDAFRSLHAQGNHYTFWGLRAGGWRKNNGVRIDHALLSPQAADLLKACSIDRHVRGWERPSDHVPLIVELASRKKMTTIFS